MQNLDALRQLYLKQFELEWRNLKFEILVFELRYLPHIQAYVLISLKSVHPFYERE